MATRFYLPATSVATPISPAAATEWTVTAALVRANTSTSSIGDAMTTVAYDDADSGLQTIIIRQYISPTLAASQTITGAQALKMQCRGLETAAGNNTVMSVGIRVIASDGSTVQKVVLAPALTHTTEFGTTLVNRQLTATSAATNYTTVAGDRLVIEVGAGGNPSGGNHHDFSLRLGDAAGADLPENSTSTNDFNPWVELTDTLTFASGTPTITSVTPSTFDNGETGIIVAGTNYGATQGGGSKVELGNSSTYGSATLSLQQITAWSDTSITFSAVKGSLDFGGLWLFVTNNDAITSAGSAITLESPPPGLTTNNLVVSAGSDDAYERDDNTLFDGTGTVVAVQSSAGASSTQYSAGLLFDTVISKYAEIESATMQVWPISFDDLVWSTMGHYAAGVDFATNADVTVRTTVVTLATRAVEQLNAGTGAYKTITPNLWPIIQELVNSKGWTDSNSIVLLLVGTTYGSTQTAWLATFEENSAHAVKLQVQWRVPPVLTLNGIDTEMEEILHPGPGRALSTAYSVGDILGCGDPDIYTDPDTGIKTIAFAANSAGQTGVRLYTLPFDADTDDWDLDRTAILNNVSHTPLVALGAGWHSERMETPSVVICHDSVLDETVQRMYYVGGNATGTSGPFEIGFLQKDSTSGGAWVDKTPTTPCVEAVEEWEFHTDGTTPFVFEPSVIYDADYDPPFRMLYSAGDELVLAYCDSQDGVTWSNKSIFFQSAIFPAWSVGWQKISNHYELITSAISRPGGMSRSWCETPSSNFDDWYPFNGILNAGAGQKWHADWAHGGAIQEGDDGRVWVYFGGRDVIHQGTYPHIGRMVLPQAATDGVIAATFPALSASVTGVKTYNITAAPTFPGLTASATGNLAADNNVIAATFPSFTASGTGTQTFSSTGAASFLPLSAAANGALQGSGEGGATFPTLSAAGVGAMLPSGTAAPTFPAFASAAVGSAGTVVSYGDKDQERLRVRTEGSVRL